MTGNGFAPRQSIWYGQKRPGYVVVCPLGHARGVLVGGLFFNGANHDEAEGAYHSLASTGNRDAVFLDRALAIEVAAALGLGAESVRPLRRSDPAPGSPRTYITWSQWLDGEPRPHTYRPEVWDHGTTSGWVDDVSGEVYAHPRRDPAQPPEGWLHPRLRARRPSRASAG